MVIQRVLCIHLGHQSLITFSDIYEGFQMEGLQADIWLEGFFWKDESELGCTADVRTHMAYKNL